MEAKRPYPDLAVRLTRADRARLSCGPRHRANNVVVERRPDKSVDADCRSATMDTWGGAPQATVKLDLPAQRLQSDRPYNSSEQCSPSESTSPLDSIFEFGACDLFVFWDLSFGALPTSALVVANGYSLPRRETYYFGNFSGVIFRSKQTQSFTKSPGGSPMMPGLPPTIREILPVRNSPPFRESYQKIE